MGETGVRSLSKPESIPEVQSQSHDGPRNNKIAGFAMVADRTRIDDDDRKATVVERRRENCMGATKVLPKRDRMAGGKGGRIWQNVRSRRCPGSRSLRC